jgi:recombination DNA repair RAD52 pathway protein
MSRGLTREQIKRLMRGIDPNHVDRKRGLAYMAQHEVRAELTRIFGFGNWDSQVESMDLLWESSGPDKDGKGTYYRACYKASVRLTIRDYWGNTVCSFVEHHAEANSNLPDRGEAHAMAITSVESYALRRAALGLGDRLGLGLYDGGSEAPLVRGTLQMTDPESPLYQPPAEKEKDASEAGAERIARMQGVVKGG